MIEESEKASSHWESNPGHLHDLCSQLVQPGVLGSVPGNYWPFHVPLFLPRKILFIPT